MSRTKLNSKKKLMVVGDRVLVIPDENKQKTTHGLYLPQGVEEKEKIQAGYVVKTGPGYPLPDPNAVSDEPWHTTSRHDPKYLPLQVEEGDYILFLRKSSVEIEFEHKKYLILPQSAVLLVIRDNLLDKLSTDDE